MFAYVVLTVGRPVALSKTTRNCCYVRSSRPYPARRLVPRAGWSAPPPFHDAAADHPNRPDDLHWKDRVALYAQFSAEETLHALLLALKANTQTGPQKDDGIDALYVFANLDIWALSHRFFGRKMDLGQFERFKRVVVAHPYNILLHDYTSRTLSAIHIAPDIYVTRRAFEYDGQELIFTFTLSRAEFGNAGDRAWMVDSIIHESLQ